MALSPMMRQYLQIKEENKDCVVLYRLGDFYEMFFEDAVEISAALGLTLTGRDCGLEERAPMCGVPYHALDQYLAKLVNMGYKAAICEQMSDPKLSKGLVERAVTRIVTSGTVIEPGLLQEKSNNFILSVHLAEENAGLCYADISTGECYCEQADGASALFGALCRIDAAETLANGDAASALNAKGIKARPVTVARSVAEAKARIYGRLGGAAEHIYKSQETVLAADALFEYLERTQKNALGHIRSITPIMPSGRMTIDEAAAKNLELTKNLAGTGRNGTLLTVLDKTATAMGARQLKSYIENPLFDVGEINRRLDAVSALKLGYDGALAIKDALAGVCDIERVVSRLSYNSVSPRDCISLAKAFERIPVIKRILNGIDGGGLLGELTERLDGMDDIVTLVKSAIADDPQSSRKEGGFIKPGYSAEVDEMRSAAENGRQWISNIEEYERAETGIKGLKIGYNRVFGYYFEVPKSQANQVPYRFTRRQTVANAERYTTEELVNTEQKLAGAVERLERLENQLFEGICGKLKEACPRMQSTAAGLKRLDALNSLALCAAEYGYCRPDMHTGFEIEINAGRHPVVERYLDEPFVPNDTYLSESERLMIITGPNMAGKSTYLRQVALIAIMAHMGGFVPAVSAKIALIDRVFTRIGAQDNLTAGQSTFMVEMSETSSILRDATRRSLIVLDEIGRGTSTFDGLAIAWAVTEHIASQSALGAKTLFATHYHELSELEGRLSGVVNYSSQVKELGESVLFLRRITRGGADRSFGVQVAALAGLPGTVVARAREVMARLEASHISHEKIGTTLLDEPVSGKGQVDFASYPYIELARKIAAMDVNAMSPIEALNVLFALREKARLV